MKMTSKFKSFFAVAAACLLAACNTPEEQINEIEVSSPDVSITKLGVGADNNAVTVEITSNTYWRAFIQEGCDWLTVSPMGGPAGTTKVEIAAASNLDGVQRTADITIEAEDDTKQIIHVSQGGQGDFVYIIEDSFGEGRDEDTDIASVTITATGVGVTDFFYSSDEAFLSKDNPSSGYEGATGGANLLVKAGGNVVLNRIGTDFTLQFRLRWGLLAGSVLPELYASADGENWGYIPYVTSGDADWVLASTKLDFRDNAQYRFFKIVNPSPEDCRIDDLVLEDAAFSAADFTNVTAAPAFAGTDWNEDDMLAVFCGERPLQFSYTGEGNIFSSIHDMAEVPEYYALYPYDGTATLSGSTISTTLRAEQTYAPESSFNVNVPMTASSSSKEFFLEPLTGVVRLNVTGDAKIFRLAINSTDAAIAGPATVNGRELTLLDGGSKSVYISLPDGIDLDKKTAIPFEFSVPEGTYADYTISAIDASGDENYFVKHGLSVRKGEVTEVNVYCGKSVIVDLNMPSYYGESGTDKVYPNCFRISEPGQYRFAPMTAQAASVSGTKADWVWATSGVWASSAEAVLENLIQDIALDKGFITFTIPEDFTPGNVFLAMVNGSGLIQYSWHIWTTLEPADITVGNVTWMDRNIGAAACFDPSKDQQLYCTASRGFYYQWGCKNPVVGTYACVKDDVFTMGNGATYYITNPDVQIFTYKGGVSSWVAKSDYADGYHVSDLEAMQNPLTFIGTTTAMPHTGGGTWPSVSNPCPHGYKVMTMANIQALGALTTICDAETATKNVASVLGTVNFPSCGYRNNATGKITLAGNPDGRYWSDNSTADNKGDYWLMNKSNNKAQAAQINCGMSVRCVRE